MSVASKVRPRVSFLGLVFFFSKYLPPARSVRLAWPDWPWPASATRLRHHQQPLGLARGQLAPLISPLGRDATASKLEYTPSPSCRRLDCLCCPGIYRVVGGRGIRVRSPKVAWGRRRAAASGRARAWAGISTLVDRVESLASIASFTVLIVCFSHQNPYDLLGKDSRIPLSLAPTLCPPPSSSRSTSFSPFPGQPSMMPSKLNAIVLDGITHQIKEYSARREKLRPQRTREGNWPRLARPMRLLDSQ